MVGTQIKKKKKKRIWGERKKSVVAVVEERGRGFCLITKTGFPRVTGKRIGKKKKEKSSGGKRMIVEKDPLAEHVARKREGGLEKKTKGRAYHPWEKNKRGKEKKKKRKKLGRKSTPPAGCKL